MKTEPASRRTIDAYIADFPPGVQEVLQKVRTTIREAAPGAEEIIKYGMPTYILKGNLVYFAAWKRHVGFYPPVVGDDTLKKEVARYEGERGALRFPLDQPIPYDLISRIVKLRVRQNQGKAEAKRGRGLRA